MFLEKSLKNYLDELASYKPAPGGGSAAAVVGALGCSLLLMVVNYSLNTKTLFQHKEHLQRVLDRAEILKATLENLSEEDAIAYSQLNDSFKLPKATEEDKTKRTQSIQNNLKNASKVPMQIAMTCQECVLLFDSVFEKSNTNLISDIGVGVIFLQSALQGAILNIEINLQSIKDQDFIGSTRNIYKALLVQCEERSKAILGKTEEIIIH